MRSDSSAPGVAAGPERDPSFSIWILATLFLLTGGAGLLVEQCFEKLLGTLVGTSTPAGAIVLAVYFAGLTAGAASYPRVFLPRVRSGLKAYAMLETGVGTWAFLLFLGFDRLEAVFVPVLALGVDRPGVMLLVRAAVAVVWIFPPTFCMGATFPAIVQSLERIRVGEPGRWVAALYGTNILGALAATIAGPYLLLPSLGTDGTLLVAGAMDVVAALGAFLLWRLSVEESRLPAEVDDSSGVTIREAGRGPMVLLAVAFGSGLLFFTLEVTWIHLLGVVIGNSVYAFATMLSSVLLGLALGGLVVGGARTRHRELSAVVPAGLLLAASLVLALQLGWWPAVPSSFLRWGPRVHSFGAGEVVRWLTAARLVFPAAFVLGMVFPLLFRLFIFPSRDRAAWAARLSAVNAVGCVTGALAAGFVLIPKIGSEATLVVVASSYAVCGGALALLERSHGTRVAFGVLAAGVLLLASTRPAWDQLALTSGEHVYFSPHHVRPGSVLRSFHEDTYGGVTTVVDFAAGGRVERTLLTNGKFQGNDTTERLAQVGFALIPILHTEERRSALVIGLGTGQSAWVPYAFGFPRIDVAEISPGIVEAARFAFPHINDHVLERPGVRLLLEDGRNALLLRNDAYDVVTMEISSVWFAGSTNLYSREFYELVKRRLTPNGVFQQWIQLHHIGTEEVGAVIATVRKVFPEVSFWLFGNQGIVVASTQPQVLRGSALERARTVAEKIGIAPEGTDAFLRLVLSSRLLAPRDTDRLVSARRFRVNTDRNRFLEYAAPRYNLDGRMHGQLNVQELLGAASYPPYDVDGATSAEMARVVRSVWSSR